MAHKDELGREGEQRAAEYLQARGFEIVDRNWRCPRGEIDLVAVRDRLIIIVEVKTRRTTSFGHPLEAVDARKRRRLWHLAHAWAAAHPEESRGRVLRLDVIGIVGEPGRAATVDHLEDLR